MGLWRGLSGRILYDTAEIGRKQIQDNKNAENVKLGNINLGLGSAEYSFSVARELFYSVITENTNLKISDDRDLMDTLNELSVIKEE